MSSHGEPDVGVPVVTMPVVTIVMPVVTGGAEVIDVVAVVQVVVVSVVSVAVTLPQSISLKSGSRGRMRVKKHAHASRLSMVQLRHSSRVQGSQSRQAPVQLLPIRLPSKPHVSFTTVLGGSGVTMHWPVFGSHASIVHRSGSRPGHTTGSCVHVPFSSQLSIVQRSSSSHFGANTHAQP